MMNAVGTTVSVTVSFFNNSSSQYRTLANQEISTKDFQTLDALFLLSWSRAFQYNINSTMLDAKTWEK